MMRIVNKQRLLIGALIALVATAAVFAFVVKPATDRINTLKRVLPEKCALVRQLAARSSQYRALRSRVNDFENLAAAGEKDCEPLAFLQSATEELGIGRNVAYMKKDVSRLDSRYSQTIAEVRLEDITFKHLVDLLLRFKSAPGGMQAKSLYIERSNTNVNLVHAVLQVSALTVNTSV